jgi:hypothetical protein
LSSKQFVSQAASNPSFRRLILDADQPGHCLRQADPFNHSSGPAPDNTPLMKTIVKPLFLEVEISNRPIVPDSADLQNRKNLDKTRLGTVGRLICPAPGEKVFQSFSLSDWPPSRIYWSFAKISSLFRG